MILAYVLRLPLESLLFVLGVSFLLGVLTTLVIVFSVMDHYRRPTR